MAKALVIEWIAPCKIRINNFITNSINYTTGTLLTLYYLSLPAKLPVSSTIKIIKFLISKKIGCSEGGFRLRDESKRAEKGKYE
jgi:hypothetical protein